MPKKRFEADKFNYEVVASDLVILKKGDRMAKDNDHYFNEDESVILKSTNFTGKIIKKLKEC